MIDLIDVGEDLIDVGELGPDPKEAEHEKPAPRQGLWNDL